MTWWSRTVEFGKAELITCALAHAGEKSCMANAQRFGSERRWFRDEGTGTLVWQLTGYHTNSQKLSYTTQSWTPDGEWIVFFSELVGERGSPMCLFKVRSDGQELVRLSDSPVTSHFACIDWPRNRVIFPTGSEVRAVGLDDFVEETLFGFWGASGFGGMTLCPDGRAALTTFNQDGVCRLVRLGLEDGETTTILEDPCGFSRAQYNLDGSGTIRFSGSRLESHPEAPEGFGFAVIEEDGTGFRVPASTPEDSGITHDSWLGNTREVVYVQCQGQRHWETYPSEIRAVNVDTGTTRVIAERGSYWHCSGSMDGSRIISDTNWPQRGLVLIDSSTGAERTLCWPGESGGAAASGHPHASFSPDGSRVLYTSDATAISQIYMAIIDVSPQAATGGDPFGISKSP
jgi:oligogalacturonide lyase